MISSTAESSPRTRAGFPMASLALLITVSACLLVCIDIARLHDKYRALSAHGSLYFVIFAGAAGVIGGSIGIVRSFFSRASWPIRLIIPLVGILAGETGLVMLLAPGHIGRTIFAVGVLLGGALLFRLDAN